MTNRAAASFVGFWRAASPAIKLYGVFVAFAPLVAVVLMTVGDVAVGVVLLCLALLNSTIILPLMSAREARRRQH